MKVWEKIAAEMTKQLKHEYKAKDAVKGDMYAMRITSCDTEREFKYIGIKRLRKHCCGRDCVDCLDEYLDMDIVAKCIHCGKETDNPVIIGPERLGQTYCSKECNVKHCYEQYPDMAEFLETMYPEWVKGGGK